MARYTLCATDNKLRSQRIAAGLCIFILFTLTSPFALAQQKPIPKVMLAAPLQKQDKLKEQLQVRVWTTDSHSLQQWLEEHLPQVQQEPTRVEDMLLLTLSSLDLAKLQQCPWLVYIDRGNRPAQEELELKDSDLSANTVTAVHAIYPNLNGNGLIVSVKETPFDTTDIDLTGRTIPSTTPAAPHSMHATTMATVIAGGGNSGPTAKGVAWGATLTSSSFSNLMPDSITTLQPQGISVQNHSYGVGVENYYGLESMAYDQQALEYPQLLHIFSSGNSGNATTDLGTYVGIAGVANLTGQFKTSKNTLSIGALQADRTVGPMSSSGPAHDGRVKPELVAHGVGGTSEAAAVASGVALLVQQAFTEQHQTLPPAALVKAILINSADDVESPHVDFKSGYGNIDALGAVQTVLEKRYTTGSVKLGATEKLLLQVPNGIQQLKVTLVWHDVAASPELPAALVNDLDLRLQHQPSGQSWQPWVLNAYPHPDSLRKTATRGTDRLNNVEQVTLQNPAPGTYEIQVAGYKVEQGSQPYSIAYEYTTNGITWIYPSQHSSLMAGTSNRLRWSDSGSGTARLEYKLNSSDTWLTAAEAVDLTQAYYDWVAPDTLALAQLRLTTATQEQLSPEFILATTATPVLTLNCGDDIQLQWPQLPGATGYQLYNLQGAYLQPLFITADTTATLNRSGWAAPYFAVAPVVQAVAAARSRAVAFNPDEELCCISSFLPRQLVMDSVIFDLGLSTVFQVQEVALERWEQGHYKVVQVLQPSKATAITLHDPKPVQGLNRYRARVRAQAQPYYSQPEEVFYTRQGFIQVVPNPVAAGQEVQVVAHGEGTAQLQLYNMMGQLLYTSSDSGALKTLPTTGLPAGMYILRLRTEKGKQLSTRLLVR